MNNMRSVTALATLAIAFGIGGAAQADPFADTAVDIQRVTFGLADNGSSELWVVLDDGDPGTDATSMPDSEVWDKSHWSTLGLDQNGTMDTSDDTGGTLLLEFTDNICLTDAGMDLDVYDAQDDESAEVEVSYDGQNFYSLGQAGPGAYELDADGVVPFFTQVRLTASDRSGTTVGNRDFSAGIDVDAVECLYSIPAQGFVYDVDSCDMTSGDAGTDIDFVLVHSDGFTAYVELFFCGTVVDSSQYAVHFGSPDNVVMASLETSTETTTTSSEPRKSKKKKSKKGKKAKKIRNAKAADPNYRAYEKAHGNANFKWNRGEDDDDDGSAGGVCGMVPQHTVTYSAGVDNGGLVFVNDRRMSVEVTYAELNAFEADAMMLWVESSNDNAPETDESDGCDSASSVDEALGFTLQ